MNNLRQESIMKEIKWMKEHLDKLEKLIPTIDDSSIPVEQKVLDEVHKHYRGLEYSTQGIREFYDYLRGTIDDDDIYDYDLLDSDY